MHKSFHTRTNCLKYRYTEYFNIRTFPSVHIRRQVLIYTHIISKHTHIAFSTIHIHTHVIELTYTALISFPNIRTHRLQTHMRGAIKTLIRLLQIYIRRAINIHTQL